MEAMPTEEPMPSRADAAVKARAPSFSDDSDAAAFAREVVSACLAQILPNATALSEERGGAEHIHQLRVGLRRLRTAIVELAEFNSGLNPLWEPPLAEVFRGLGSLRDGQILALENWPELRAGGAPELGTEQLATPQARPQDLLRSTQFQAVLQGALTFAVGAAPGDGEAFDGTPMEALAGRLDQLHEQLRRAAKRFLALPAEAQHRVRKHLKRLRYLAEFIGPLCRESRLTEYLDALKPAQDALGRQHDEWVAMQAYAALAERTPGSGFAVGWLTARQAQSALDAAKALKKAGKARRFWR